jgi:hypothetical protein
MVNKDAICFEDIIGVSLQVEGTASSLDVKPRIKRSDSLLEILYDCMKSIVAADVEDQHEIQMDFLKYYQDIDIQVNRHLQDFLFQMGFSISTEAFSSPYLNIKIRWHNKETVLKLVNFVVQGIDVKELFK